MSAEPEEIPLRDLGAKLSVSPTFVQRSPSPGPSNTAGSFTDARGTPLAPRLTLSPAPTSAIPLPPDIELPLPPSQPPSPTRLSRAAKGKGRAVGPAVRTHREVWDVDDSFEENLEAGKNLGKPREGIGPQRKLSPTSILINKDRQPSRQPPMPKPNELFPPEIKTSRRPRALCLDGPAPKNPEHSYGRWLGELCIGVILCQCFLCCREDPEDNDE